jgi:hypothetical protein
MGYCNKAEHIKKNNKHIESIRTADATPGTLQHRENTIRGSYHALSGDRDHDGDE